jgi:RNA polymerase sigma factor (sigma-70 family)
LERLPAAPSQLRAIWHVGGGAMNHKPPHLKWLHRLSPQQQQALRDLPKPLQDAVHDAVAACKPQNAPRPYGGDWLEELYSEAIAAAWEAQQSYDPNKGCSLYGWGLRVIGQRLQGFCDRVWNAARHECDYPCDEETGEEMEFPDEQASEEMELSVVYGEIREALMRLNEAERQLIEWHYGDEALSVREIAARLGVSKSVAHKRLQRAIVRLRSEYYGDSGVSKGRRCGKGADKRRG